jgi:signal transduction histidine kinase
MAHVESGYIPKLAIGNLQTAEGHALKSRLEASPVLAQVPLLSSAGDATRIAERVSDLLASLPPGPHELDPVEFVAASYGAMSAQLPLLLSQLRELAQVAGKLPELESELNAAQAGGRRMRSFVRYLRDYGHAPGEPRAPTDVLQALRLALEIADHEITQCARLVKEISVLPTVMAAERQLSHVYLSVLINAAHSIAKGSPDANSVRVRAFTDAHGWAVVEVIDSGSGIDPEILPHIFDPYFSTKRGAGMGLGLYLSRASLAAWGGNITCVSSALGKGSTFRIEMPPAAPRPAR